MGSNFNDGVEGLADTPVSELTLACAQWSTVCHIMCTFCLIAPANSTSNLKPIESQLNPCILQEFTEETFAKPSYTYMYMHNLYASFYET